MHENIWLKGELQFIIPAVLHIITVGYNKIAITKITAEIWDLVTLQQQRLRGERDQL